MANNSYVESIAVKKAQELLNQQLASKPGAYQSQWQAQLNDTINKILNREKFSYDLNGDMLYQQYKDQYTTQGNMAMMDTMGQAQAMTGGYGNSYAQTAGQQTYQNYLQQLNDKVPELYQLALNKYNQDGQDLYNKYSLLGTQEEQDYNRYQNNLAQWQTELDRLQNQYNNEREFDYGKYVDDRNYQYQVDRDKVADEQWLKEYEEALRQYNQNYQYQVNRDLVSDSQWQQEFNEAIRQANQNYQYQVNRDKVADSQWQKEFDESVRQYNLSNSVATTPAEKAQASLKEKVNNGGGTPAKAKFTGSTYSEAVAYLKSNGVDAASASSIMTESEWKRRKQSYTQYGTGGAEVKNYSTYKEYLADIVEYKLGG